MLNWTPNWTEAHIDGEFVEFPDYHPECHERPEWGYNKNLSHDCGNPKNGWIKKATWAGFEEFAPCAAQLVKNVSFTTEMISNAASWVVSDGMTEKESAQQWLETYQDIIRQWMPNCTAE